jgi:protein TonB
MIGFMIISWLVSYRLKSKFKEYSQVAFRGNMTGAEIAARMLQDNGINDVKIIKGIGAGCDEEAARVMQSAPPWNPGKQRGKAVKQRYTLPIIFKLG